MLFPLFLLLINCAKKPTEPVAVGSLGIYSYPSYAHIYLDGKDTGSLTPFIMYYIPAGKHIVRLELYTYFDTTFTVEIQKNQYTQMEIDLIRKPLSEGQLSSDLGESHNSSWSPDGLKIAFDSKRYGGWKIYEMDYRGEAYGLSPLTDLGDDHSPDWSADGLKIAFESSGDIWVIDSRGQDYGVRQLTDNHDIIESGGEYTPCWSPDDKYIAFLCTWIGESIWMTSYWVNPLDSEIIQLTDPAQPSKDPDWSPDGNQILYSRFFDNNWDLWVIDLREEHFMPYRLTKDPAVDLLPSYSPHGSEIAFFSVRDGDSAIWIIDSRGEDYGKVKLVSQVRPFKPNWSPDGSKITFCRWDRIWVISGLE